MTPEKTRSMLWIVIATAGMAIAFLIFFAVMSVHGPSAPYTPSKDNLARKINTIKAVGDGAVEALSHEWNADALTLIMREEHRKGTLYEKLLTMLPIMLEEVGEVESRESTVIEEGPGNESGIGALYRYTAKVQGKKGDCNIIIAIATDAKGPFILAIEVRKTAVLRA